LAVFFCLEAKYDLHLILYREPILQLPSSRHGAFVRRRGEIDALRMGRRLPADLGATREPRGTATLSGRRRRLSMAIVRMTLEEALAAASELPPEYYERLAAMTDEEIDRRALSDPDAQPMTDDELACGVAGRRVRLARERDGLSQEAFAARYGLPLATVEALEDGRHLPDPALDAYLKAIERDPQAVRRAWANGGG
jgi:putative transcriptional regulator